MAQINKYFVSKIELGESESQTLTDKDGVLITSYSLGTVPFLVDKYRLDATFYTPDNLFLETVEDLKSYSVLGANHGEAATEIVLNPVQDALDRGYLGDVQIEYRVTNNLFSPSQSLDSETVLFIREISADRTEIRATSVNLTESQLQGYAQDLYQKLNLAAYFEGVNLHFIDEGESTWCVNVMTEVLDGNLVVAFKTYEPLPDNVTVKSRFTVLEQIGEPVRFEVVREVEVTGEEDTTPRLKGPNFDVETQNLELGTVTDYLNYKELFSYPEANRKSDLYSIYKEQGVEINIDHSDFSNFIHFSSAAERLENFRYKLGLIQGYEQEIERTSLESEKKRLEGLISGIISNFDHYDRYLYYENTSTSWPKALRGRPYVNLPLDEANEWFEKMLEKAQDYDEHNSDILVNTIPQTIRLDSRNEPYLLFVHMIGQHFDEEWAYAKAVAERFNGDNRLNFGISKDLVREALKSFGVELETTNQNLEELFRACVPGERYNAGDETSVRIFRRATVNLDGHSEPVYAIDNVYDGEYTTPYDRSGSDVIDGEYAIRSSSLGDVVDGGNVQDGWSGTTAFQPVFVDDYRKEIYKRIYHNIPLLLKTKGTSRGLRALISCFGIPEDLLQISVAGGANLDQEGPFFGPEYQTTSSLERIRIDSAGSVAPLMFDESTGTFVSGTILTLDRQIQQKNKTYQPGTNDVEVGFRLNGQIDRQVKEYLASISSSFDYDDIVGDPRNTGENYGEAFTLLRNQILPELWDSEGNLQIRTPTAVLRLIRYYDSALFRTLQSFVPARDVVSTGAIVDDNILHRNKYKELEPDVKNLDELTASIETVFIDGGEGGSLKVLRGGRPVGKAPQTQSFVIRATVGRNVTESRECPSVDYIEKDGQSIGSQYEDKMVYDDSPRYNGELSGTTYEVTDGELNDENKFKHGGSTSKELKYYLDYRFLCLPRTPIDTILNVTSRSVGELFNVIQDPSRNTCYLLFTETGDRKEVDLSGNTAGSLVLTADVMKVSGIQIKVGSDNQDQQGWVVCFTGDKTEVYHTNCPGMDMSTDPAYGGWAEDAKRKAEVGRVFNGSGSLLPVTRFVGEDGQNYMTGLFMPPDGELVNDIWDKYVVFPRSIYSRTNTPGDPEVNKQYVFSINYTDDLWKTLVLPPQDEMTIDKLESGAAVLLDISVPEFQEKAPVSTLESFVKQIYLKYSLEGIGTYYIVLDFENKKIRLATSTDYQTWVTEKNYGEIWDDPEANVTTYWDSRYDKNKIIGVRAVRSAAKNLESVLMESYMGCPYIFGKKGDADCQVTIKEWIE